MLRPGLLYFIMFIGLVSGCGRDNPGDLQPNGAFPDIFPDYRTVTVPPNIAPLNFILSGDYDQTLVRVSGRNAGYKFSFSGNKVRFPVGKWHRLLGKSAGERIRIEIFARTGRKWTRFRPFSIGIAADSVDETIVYRLIMPGFQNWNQMGLYQRSLSGFRVKTVADSRVLPGTCMNCHSFSRNNPDNMVFHLRESYGGTILYQNGKLKKINTKTGEMFANAAFPSWHPANKFIAFSVNRVNQIFHASGPVRASAVDMKSDVYVYDIEKNEMLSSPLLSGDDKFETFPCFSADGFTLYYCAASPVKLPEKFDKIKYSLCSVSFDPVVKKFGGKVDTLISAAVTGKSISIPRISPDGRFLMYCMSDFGAFPSYNPEADLGLLNLKTNTFAVMDSINSNNVESWHSWSSNGRWIVFSSRRLDGLYSNVYLAHVDESGIPGKPFLLPQKDPEFYRKFLFSFNVPEFAVKEIKVSPYQVERAARSTRFTQVQSGSH